MMRRKLNQKRLMRREMKLRKKLNIMLAKKVIQVRKKSKMFLMKMRVKRMIIILMKRVSM